MINNSSLLNRSSRTPTPRYSKLKEDQAAILFEQRSEFIIKVKQTFYNEIFRKFLKETDSF